MRVVGLKRMRSWMAVVAGFAAVVSLTSCTSPSKPDASDSQAEGDIGVCDTVSDELAAEVNPERVDLVETLLTGYPSFAGCTVGDAYSFSFGARVIDTEESLAELADRADESDAVDGIGDEAYRSDLILGGELAGYTIAARFGDNVVLVINSTVDGSNPKERISDNVTKKFINAFGEALPADFAQQALTTSVGDGCLPADHASITALVDKVQLARGGFADEVVRCTYLSENLDIVQVTKESTKYVGGEEQTGEAISVRGAKLARLMDGSFGLEGEFGLENNAGGNFSVTPGSTARNTKITKDKVIAMLEAFIAEQSPTGQSA